MKRAVIGIPALALAGLWLPAAVPGMPIALPIGADSGAAALSITDVRYHRHYRHHYHRYYGGTAAETPAPEQGIKAGEWEFAAQLQTEAVPSAADGRAQPAPPAGGLKSLYRSCIAPEAAVPAALGPGCKLDAAARDGPRITWSMTCSNPRNLVHSDGIAQYSGDTMTGAMTSHLPAGAGANGGKSAAGKLIDLTQRITGRYLGPCPQSAQNAVRPQNPLIPPRGTAPPNTVAEGGAQWVEPPASPAKSAAAARPAAAAPAPAAPSEGSTSPAAAAPAAPANAEGTAGAVPSQAEAEAAIGVRPEGRGWQRRYYTHHRYHYRHYRRWGGYYYGAGYGFGPSPYSANGY